MARRLFPPVQVERVRPDHLARLVILAHHAIALMADQVVTVLQLPRQPGVTVRIRVIHRQGNLARDPAARVHLDDPLIAGLRDHRQAVLQPLKGVDLHRTAVTLLRLRDILPDDLLVRRHLHNGCRPSVQQVMPVRQRRDIVGGKGARHLPLHLTLRADDGDPVFALHDDAVRKMPHDCEIVRDEDVA